MDERLMQFRVGVMVLATIITAGILVVLFGDSPTFARGAYPVKIYFEKAPGVTRDTPVRKFGVLVGRVTDVSFDEEHDRAIVTASIDGDRVLYKHEIPRITLSLLGDATIEMIPVRKPGAPRLPIGTDALDGELTPSPLDSMVELQGRIDDAFKVLEETSKSINATAAGIRETSSSFTRTGDQWTMVGKRVNELLSGGNEQDARNILMKVERLIENVNAAVVNVDMTVTEVRKVASDERNQMLVKQTLEELPKTVATGRETMLIFQRAAAAAEGVMAGAKNTMVNVDKAVASVDKAVNSADRNLQNLEKLTAAAAERGPELMRALETAGANAAGVVLQAQLLLKNLNNPDGTLGQFLSNSDLYMNVNQVAERVNVLLKEARPILEDVRVITDNFARHPGDVGVRGVFKREPGIK